MIDSSLRPFWRNFFQLNWKFGLFLILALCIPRFLLVLQANQTGNYGFIGAIMFISAIVPFIFLSKAGRAQIGLIKSNAYGMLIAAFIIGIALSLFLHVIGKLLYEDSFQNWYAYIGKSYNIPEVISASDKFTLFLVMAITGMIFSPIGEELFFRGVVHGSFAKSIGEQKASIVDSLAFALTHIAHFGLVFINGNWTFYFVPTLLWVIGMFLVSIAFFQMKNSSGSILGAILCHAGFNLGMIYCIFYLV